MRTGVSESQAGPGRPSDPEPSTDRTA
ncbi:MAG: hypothetical protein QOJ09_253, partial [Actinomycetota bacterium]|nr:hypothetical protein [Actinomycetota bacterium]